MNKLATYAFDSRTSRFVEVRDQPAASAGREGAPRESDRRTRLQRYWRGHVAEWLAMLHLGLRGYKILAHRFRTPFGEIDIVVRRGNRLAFVEVKRRPSLAEAEWSLTPRQAERIGRAAEHFMRRHPRYRNHEMGMDLIAVGPGGWPRHLVNAFHGSWDAWRRR